MEHTFSDTASHPRRLESSAAPPSEPQELQALQTHQIFVLTSHYECHVLTCQHSMLDNLQTQSHPDTFATNGNLTKLKNVLECTNHQLLVPHGQFYVALS
jgi:hypothetical protein